MTEDWGMVHTIFTMAAPILKINVETNTQIDFDDIVQLKIFQWLAILWLAYLKLLK